MPQTAGSAPRFATGERLRKRPFSLMHKKRALYSLWIAAILTLFCLHFPHLLADFPNNSPWMDYSKYTDEGWYANAAVRYHLTGHWYLHGDFNPAVALPVWPLLLACVFHWTGVSLASARALSLAIYGLNLLLAYCIVRTQDRHWVALLAVSILVSNPFLYAFSRLALLEPLLTGILLLSWLLALRLPRATPRAQHATLIGIGLLLWVLILTKTTALFILPSTFYLVAYAYRFRTRAFLRALAVTATAAALPWCAWYFLLVRPHYRVDYQYLFEANRWPQPTTVGGWIAAFWYAFHGSLWISATLCIAAAAVLLVTLIPPERTDQPSREPLWKSPLIIASLLTAGGYIFFAGWHNNPQPRYYEIVIYPLAFVLALGVADLFRRTRAFRLAGAVVVATIFAIGARGAFQIAGYVRHPQYTWVNAAEAVTRTIDQHPGSYRLLLSVSADQIALLTQLPAICDDYGTWDLPYRIHQYQPGWFATWNDIDSGTLADLQTLYSLQRIASFPAFDDPDRNLLILYRLRPLPPSQQTYPIEEEAAENAGK